MGTDTADLVIPPDARVLTTLPVGVDSVVWEAHGVAPVAPEAVLENVGPRHVKRGRRRGQVVQEGYLDNLTVWVTNDPSTVVMGSHAKSLLGQNDRLLGPDGLGAAVVRVADRLDLPFDQVRIGSVYSVHVASDLPTDRPPVDYVTAMVEAPRLRRRELGPASVVFAERSRRRELAGYDKGLEMGDPDGPYRLRLEARFLSKIGRRFGQDVFVEDLWDRPFTARLVEAWRAEFLAVRVDDVPLFPPDATPAVLRKYLARESLSAPGAARVLAMIDANRASGRVSTRRASDQRAEVRALLSDTSVNEPSPLADELSREIQEAARATLSRLH